MAIGVTRKLEAWLRFGDVGSRCISKLIHCAGNDTVGIGTYWVTYCNCFIKVSSNCSFYLQFLRYLAPCACLISNTFVFAHMRLSLCYLPRRLANTANPYHLQSIPLSIRVPRATKHLFIYFIHSELPCPDISRPASAVSLGQSSLQSRSGPGRLDVVRTVTVIQKSLTSPIRFRIYDARTPVNPVLNRKIMARV